VFGAAPATREAERSLPDFAAIHQQRQTQRSVTLLLLWEEYQDANPDAYRYSKFCELYQRSVASLFAPIGIRNHPDIRVNSGAVAGKRSASEENGSAEARRNPHSDLKKSPVHRTGVDETN
jgi:hypothetical protein